jgi:hypothetical protein
MTFDVRHIGSIRYTNTMGADVKLREDLEQAIEALGYRKRAKSPAPSALTTVVQTLPAPPADLLSPVVAATHFTPKGQRRRHQPGQRRPRTGQ